MNYKFEKNSQLIKNQLLTMNDENLNKKYGVLQSDLQLMTKSRSNW